MPTASDCGLIVFLRLPEKGRVKTRIASSMGEEAAFSIYQELTSITLGVVSNIQSKTFLFYEGGLPPVSDRMPGHHYLNQATGDLGVKMLNAFEIVLSECTKAVIIGSDCPVLSSIEIEDAFANLETHDIVIGPSEDGGYYLLGCKEVIPSLFNDMEWSTSTVLQKTITVIEQLQINYHLLRTLADIDTAEDWTRFKKSRP